MAIWVQQVVPCGVLMLSVYLFTVEGPSPRNVELLGEALRVARACGSPWILGGDFQDAPQEDEAWAGAMVEKAGGKFFFGEEPSVYPSNGE